MRAVVHFLNGASSRISDFISFVFQSVRLAPSDRGYGIFVYEAVAEMHRGLIDSEGLLIGEKRLVAALRWDKMTGHVVRLSQGTKRTEGTKGVFAVLLAVFVVSITACLESE